MYLSCNVTPINQICMTRLQLLNRYIIRIILWTFSPESILHQNDYFNIYVLGIALKFKYIMFSERLKPKFRRITLHYEKSITKNCYSTTFFITPQHLVCMGMKCMESDWINLSIGWYDRSFHWNRFHHRCIWGGWK